VSSTGTESPQSSYASATVSAGSGGGSNTLTLTGYSGVFTVIVTSTAFTNDNYNSAISNTVATGTAASGSSADLTWISGGGGTYHVLVTVADGSTGSSMRYRNNVSFSNGSATVNWNGMTEITTVVDPGVGSVSFTGGLPSGIWSIMVVPGPITTLLEYSTAVSNIVALGASTVTSGNAATLVTTGATGGTFNPNGTYTILYTNADNPTDPVNKYQNNITFSGGNATINVSAMSNISDLPFGF
jgi:hypothetical protein